jgi:hypothetical protein
VRPSLGKDEQGAGLICPREEMGWQRDYRIKQASFDNPLADSTEATAFE